MAAAAAAHTHTRSHTQSQQSPLHAHSTQRHMHACTTLSHMHARTIQRRMHAPNRVVHFVPLHAEALLASQEVAVQASMSQGIAPHLVLHPSRGTAVHALAARPPPPTPGARSSAAQCWSRPRHLHPHLLFFGVPASTERRQSTAYVTGSRRWAWL